MACRFRICRAGPGWQWELRAPNGRVLLRRSGLATIDQAMAGGSTALTNTNLPTGNAYTAIEWVPSNCNGINYLLAAVRTT